MLSRLSLRRAALGIALIGFLAVGLFLVATRTQTGRDVAARQAVVAFNRAFEGTLKVGPVTGTLVRDVKARDVRLFAPDGSLVLAIDSVTMRPRWRALLRRTFVADKVVLFRPQLQLAQDREGTWNLMRALQRRTPQPEDAPPLDLQMATLRLLNGQLTTTSERPSASAVRAGHVFDYLNTSLVDLDAQLVLDFRRSRNQIGIESLTALAPHQDLKIESLRVRLRLGPSDVQVDGLRLRTAQSRLEGRLSVSRPPADPQGSASSPADPWRLALTLQESTLAGRELQALLPVLPLSDVFSLSGQLEGSLDSLHLSDFRIRRGASGLTGEGHVVLGESPSFQIDAAAPTLQATDLYALFPTLPHASLANRLGLVSAEGRIQGTLDNGAVALTSDLTLSSDAGAGRGTLRISQPLSRLSLDATVERVDPAILLDRPQLAGDLNGQLAIQTPLNASARETRFNLQLGPSRLAGRAADSLFLEGALLDSQVESTVALYQALSVLRGAATMDLESETLRFDGAMQAFDLKRLFLEAPTTRLTGPIEASASGFFSNLTGTVEADFQRVAVQSDGALQALTPGVLRLTLASPNGPTPTLQLESPWLFATLGGGLETLDALALGRQWAATLGSAGMAEYYKSRTPVPDSLRFLARETLDPPTDSRSPIAAEPFDLAVELRDPAVLAVLAPTALGVPRGTRLELSGVAGTDTLSLRGRGQTARLRDRTLAIEALSLDIAFDGSDGPNPMQSASATLRLQADSLTVAGRTVLFPTLDARLDRGSIALQVDTREHDDALALRATLDLLADRNRLTIEDADIGLAGTRWRTDDTTTIDLFYDAAVLHDLAFVRERTARTERVAFRGTISSLPTDTLIADVSGIDLRVLSETAGRSFRGAYPGGRLDARLAFTNLFSRPEVTGQATVPQLLFGNHVLGGLTVSSRYIPGTETVALNLDLSPLPNGERHTDGERHADSLHVEPNSLQLVGRLRLPGQTATGVRDPGLLDLRLTADRIDLFFFDFLFAGLIEESQGGLRGAGRIAGTFSRPLFSGRLTARDAAAAIPRFGLSLTGQGYVEIDEDGIHLTRVQLADQQGGTARVGGSLLFNQYRFFSLDLSGILDEMTIIDVADPRTDLPFYGHVQASGTVSVTGPLDHVSVRSSDAVTTPGSEVVIPVSSDAREADRGFLLFADADGQIPEPGRRTAIIGPKPSSERTFVGGLDLNLNVTSLPGTTVRLVLDPVTGEEIRAQGRANLQLTRREGRLLTFGQFTTSGGEYLFTAGDVFTRRFEIGAGGTLIWDGPPLQARLDLSAGYRTRAALAGLGLAGVEGERVPLVIQARLRGRLSAPLVTLSIDLEADQRTGASAAAVEALRPLLNDADRRALYATSVLLTGTFLLAPADDVTSGTTAIGEAADDLFYTSLSQLVASRLNSFLNDALAADNLDVLFGLQPGEQFRNFDVTYGVALRLLDERLVIRGEGVYQQLENSGPNDALQGELALELHLTDHVALEVFYRRESEVLSSTSVGSEPYGAYGAGLAYETEFSSWRRTLHRLLGG